MMLAAQCHLGTKYVRSGVGLQPPRQDSSSRFRYFRDSAGTYAGLYRNCDFQMERYVWRRRQDGAMLHLNLPIVSPDGVA